jgi:transcription termination factor Rho
VAKKKSPAMVPVEQQPVEVKEEPQEKKPAPVVVKKQPVVVAEESVNVPEKQPSVVEAKAEAGASKVKTPEESKKMNTPAALQEKATPTSAVIMEETENKRVVFRHPDTNSLLDQMFPLSPHSCQTRACTSSYPRGTTGCFVGK